MVECKPLTDGSFLPVPKVAIALYAPQARAYTRPLFGST